MLNLLALTLLLPSISLASPLVIYGEDNRVEVHQSKKPMLKKVADSTAAMILKDYISISSGMAEIKGPLLKDLYKLCSTERFREQVAAANCSGTLIDKDIILTAGHCYEHKGIDCKSYSWVFDYRAMNEKQAVVKVPASSVYHCKEVIAVKDQRSTNTDYALIRLDRKVTDRKAANIRLTGEINSRDKLAVIGHPRGVPAKVADQGDVLQINEHYIVSNLDVYTMNSGSGVFNERTGEIEGIVVSGENDFESDLAAGCLKSRRLSESEGAEIITKIQAIWDLIDLF